MAVRSFDWAARGGAICLGIARGLSYLHSQEVRSLQPLHSPLHDAAAASGLAESGAAKAVWQAVSRVAKQGVCADCLHGGCAEHRVLSAGTVAGAACRHQAGQHLPGQVADRSQDRGLRAEQVPMQQHIHAHIPGCVPALPQLRCTSQESSTCFGSKWALSTRWNSVRMVQP